MIYFTGCTHFGHANIISLCNRPFGSVEEMDEAMIQNWNRTVRPKDVVYHLGDFAFRNADRAENVLAKLNGTIHLIEGNHDPAGFAGERYVEFKHNKRLFCLFHYPIEEWNGWFRNSVHLHAHTHSKVKETAKNRISVGVDAWDFRPASIEEIEAMVEAR